MSKQSAITQSTISSKPGTKSKTSLRGSYGKLTLDPTKFDFKSIVPSTTVASSSHYSPANAQSEKFVLMAHQTKSPRANNNPLGLSIENFDPKDTYTIDRKVHPQTTKASIRTSCAILGTDKSKKASNPNEKSIPSKSKDAKAAIYNYEAFTQKKLAQGKEKDSKSKIMEEPPKKFSMPANIPSSVSSIYATGSNSHRAPLNSIPAEQINTNNRPFVYVPLNRRNSQKSNIDSESHQAQNYNSTSSQNKHLIPNNFFVDLASTSQEKHSPKASAHHNAAGINHHLSVPGDKVQSQKDSDLLRLVSDKNKEIYTLSQDKAKLKSTLDMLSDEVQSIKKMRGALKDKEKLIENLQASLTEAVKESQTLKKGLQKESGNSHDENAHYEDPHDEHKRSRAHPSISDMDGVKALISQLKALTDGSEEHHDSLELKNSLLEAITKKNQSKPKKQEVSYALFSLENKPDKGSQHSEQGNSTIDLYQRNFSGTLDDALVKKINESPYYDSLRNGPKKTEKASSGPKKNAFTQKKPDSQSGKQTVPATAGGIGTPRRTELEVVHKKQGRGQTSASGMNMDILKRKFSHEPRMNSEGLTDLFIKKQSGEAGSTLAYTAEREPVGENMDMGKALGELKNRIAKLLNKHKDDHKKLISTYELYAQKLEKLSKE